VPDAEVSLIDEQGKYIINKGYLRFDNSAFTIGSDDAATF
jgi:hypothetical protein